MMIMKKISRNNIIIACVSIMTCIISSCDKLDCNGDLDGMWQMTRWEDKNTGYVYATNEDNIYYHVKLELMKFQKIGFPFVYLTTFHYTKDSLFIDNVYSQPFDIACPYDSLSSFGVGSDGKFRINSLNNSNMELENNLYILKFRKY